MGNTYIFLFNRSKGRAIVVGVPLPLAECTVNITVCIVEHRPPPCAVTRHKTCTNQQQNRFQNSARIQDQRSMCWQHAKQFDRSQ